MNRLLLVLLIAFLIVFLAVAGLDLLRILRDTGCCLGRLPRLDRVGSYCAANRLNRAGTDLPRREVHYPWRVRADAAASFRQLWHDLGADPLPYVWVPEWHPSGARAVCTLRWAASSGTARMRHAKSPRARPKPVDGSREPRVRPLGAAAAAKTVGGVVHAAVQDRNSHVRGEESW